MAVWELSQGQVEGSGAVAALPRHTVPLATGAARPAAHLSKARLMRLYHSPRGLASSAKRSPSV